MYISHRINPALFEGAVRLPIDRAPQTPRSRCLFLLGGDIYEEGNHHQLYVVAQTELQAQSYWVAHWREDHRKQYRAKIYPAWCRGRLNQGVDEATLPSFEDWYTKPNPEDMLNRSRASFAHQEPPDYCIQLTI